MLRRISQIIIGISRQRPQKLREVVQHSQRARLVQTQTDQIQQAAKKDLSLEQSKRLIVLICTMRKQIRSKLRKDQLIHKLEEFILTEDGLEMLELLIKRNWKDIVKI
jgi:hypothetical protein